MNCLCPPISFLHENSATVRQHLTPLARLDSQMDKNKRRWGCGEIGTLEYGCRECEVGRCWGGSLGAPQTIRRRVTTCLQMLVIAPGTINKKGNNPNVHPPVSG